MLKTHNSMTVVTRNPLPKNWDQKLGNELSLLILIQAFLTGTQRTKEKEYRFEQRKDSTSLLQSTKENIMQEMRTDSFVI